ncbi:MAG: hypothetical protein WDZ49_17070 [Litorilinea sp.]
MSLPNGFDLATDAAFRLVAGFTEPPKAGRVLAIEANGQARIELDDADGGEVLAWPLNGFGYAVNDVVYVLFAANAPESGIILGSIAPAPTLPGAVIDDHGDIPGLSDDDHTQYVQLAGRSGGQVLRGGTASGDDLTLESTSHATKGDVLLQPNGGGLGVGVSGMSHSGLLLEVDSNGAIGNAITANRLTSGASGGNPRALALIDSDGVMRVWRTHASFGVGIEFIRSTGDDATDAAAAWWLIAVTGAGQATGAMTFRNRSEGTNTDHMVLQGGRTAIGGSAPAASAKLDIQGTDGALLLPRLTTTQRNALTAANGMVIFNTTTNKVQARAGGAWVDLH